MYTFLQAHGRVPLQAGPLPEPRFFQYTSLPSTTRPSTMRLFVVQPYGAVAVVELLRVVPFAAAKAAQSVGSCERRRRTAR